MAFKFIAGPCVIEDESLTYEIAARLKEITSKFSVDFYFKASFDKANRSSIGSYRGPGIEKGIEILSHIKDKLKIKITTDVHLPSQIEIVKDVADVLQIPAFLCRQTDLIIKAAETMKTVNIKKGQFLSPYEVKNIIDKVRSVGNSSVWITERGTTFGYNRLVVDMTGIPIMKKFGVPIIIDATHSVQMPGAGEGITLGNREFVPTIACSAVAAGADGVFLEVHPSPNRSPSDSANIYYLDKTKKLLKKLLTIYSILD
jgi:2-dehydro-3-deoxyphosphooctonate aldolase (KDO 8-P synthase)